MTGRRSAGIALLLAAGCAATPEPERSPALSGVASLRALAERSAVDDDPATVDLLLAADGEFLRHHGGNTARVLEEAVATLDRVLGAATGRRFRIGGATSFPSTPGVRDDLRLLWEARLRVPRGRHDIVAVFTGQDCGPRAGIAEPRHRLVLCAEVGDPERSLLHETAHLFGARDHDRGHPGYSIPSVMSYDSDQPRTLEFDAATLARLKARGGALPPALDNGVPGALEARARTLDGGTSAALLGAFLCAESRRSQRDGLAPAALLLDRVPDDPVAAWCWGECLRVERDVDGGRTLFLMALQGLAGRESPDALDRHVTLEMANLVVDDVDGTGALADPLEAALRHLLESFPADARLLDALGSLRLRAGDLPAAGTLYRAALEADPGATWAWRHLGAVARSSGDAKLWLEAWRGFRDADAPDPVADVRWVAEGLKAFPLALRDTLPRREIDAALVAAIEAFHDWPEPRALLGRPK